jgi:hypothetical protein
LFFGVIAILIRIYTTKQKEKENARSNTYSIYPYTEQYKNEAGTAVAETCRMDAAVAGCVGDLLVLVRRLDRSAAIRNIV